MFIHYNYYDYKVVCIVVNSQCQLECTNLELVEYAHMIIYFTYQLDPKIRVCPLA